MLNSLHDNQCRPQEGLPRGDGSIHVCYVSLQHHCQGITWCIRLLSHSGTLRGKMARPLPEEGVASEKTLNMRASAMDGLGPDPGKRVKQPIEMQCLGLEPAWIQPALHKFGTPSSGFSMYQIPSMFLLPHFTSLTQMLLPHFPFPFPLLPFQQASNPSSASSNFYSVLMMLGCRSPSLPIKFRTGLYTEHAHMHFLLSNMSTPAYMSLFCIHAWWVAGRRLSTSAPIHHA
jgi:hypothetical protein